MVLAGRCAGRRERARGARSRRPAAHDQAHAEPRRLSVDPRHRARSGGGDAARSSKRRRSAPIRSAIADDARRSRSKRRKRARAIAGASCAASTRGAATPRWMVHAPRAQRHPLDQRARRHHQLRDARARASRCTRSTARRLEGGIRVRYARAGETLELLNGADADARSGLSRDRRRGEGRRARRHHGRRSTPRSAMRRATSSSKARSSRPTRSPANRACSGFGSDSSFRFERGVDFGATPARARPRDAARARDLRRTARARSAKRARRCPRASRCGCGSTRAERVLGIELDARSSGDILRRLGFELTSARARASR